MYEFIDRLKACGFTDSNAVTVCLYYTYTGDYDGLETFVTQAEKTNEVD